jgi:copper chaperone
MTQQTQLNVQGMTCPSCVRHVRTALSEVDGVTSVDVRLREARVLVEHDPMMAPASKLVAALREAGYESSTDVAA